MDRRAPKVRLLTRRAHHLIGQRLVIRVDRWRAGSRYPEAHVVRALGPAAGAYTRPLLSST
jgi:exosome complex exonuclease DIS3/RRP44